jgi:hypothetical protein
VTPTDDPQPDERKAAPDQQMLPERTLKLWLANFELTLTGQFSPEDVRDWYTGIGTLLVFVVVGTFASKVRAIDVDRGFYAMAAGAIPVLLVAFGIEQGIPSSSPARSGSISSVHGREHPGAIRLRSCSERRAGSRGLPW